MAWVVESRTRRAGARSASGTAARVVDGCHGSRRVCQWDTAWDTCATDWQAVARERIPPCALFAGRCRRARDRPRAVSAGSAGGALTAVAAQPESAPGVSPTGRGGRRDGANVYDEHGSRAHADLLRAGRLGAQPPGVWRDRRSMAASHCLALPTGPAGGCEAPGRALDGANRYLGGTCGARRNNQRQGR